MIWNTHISDLVLLFSSLINLTFLVHLMLIYFSVICLVFFYHACDNCFFIPFQMMIDWWVSIKMYVDNFIKIEMIKANGCVCARACVFHQNDSITMAVAHQAKYRPNNLIAKIKEEKKKIGCGRTENSMERIEWVKNSRGISCINQINIFIQWTWTHYNTVWLCGYKLSIYIWISLVYLNVFVCLYIWCVFYDTVY